MQDPLCTPDGFTDILSLPLTQDGSVLVNPIQSNIGLGNTTQYSDQHVSGQFFVWASL